MGGARRLGRGRPQRRRRRWRETRRGGESGAVCVRLATRAWGRKSVCASSVSDGDRDTIGAGVWWSDKRQERRAHHGQAARESGVRECARARQVRRRGGSTCRSWVSVCVVGRGRSAPEKKEERPKGDQAKVARRLGGTPKGGTPQRRFSIVRGHAPFTVVAVNWHFYPEDSATCAGRAAHRPTGESPHFQPL